MRSLLIFFYTLLIFLAFIKFDYINPKNTEWLYSHADNAIFQTGWFFFKNDIWRFPLGLNPNYGESFSSSIVFSDSIPLLALFFKIIGFKINESYQFASTWILLCIYLQFFFSFKILHYFTKNSFYSFIGANFYLLTPIFIYRLTLHFSLSAHWIILWCLYLILKYKFNLPTKKTLFLVIISFSVQFYLTIIILIPICFNYFFKFFLNMDKKKNIIKDIFLILFSSLLLMYLLGYFEIRLVDSAAIGYGKWKLNLLSIFDPQENWSSILKALDIPEEEKIEGFNYFGLGQLLLIFFFFSQIININKKDNNIVFEKKFVIFLFAVLLFITILSLSHKISFGKYLLFEIKINEFLYGILSIIRSSGRLFWLVNYTLLTLAIIFLFKKKKKKKNLVILLIFLFQIIDTYPGLKKNFKKNLIQNNYSKNNNYDDIFLNFQKIKTTQPSSYNQKFLEFSNNFEKFNTLSTNLVILARTDREKIALERYNQNKRLFLKRIDDNEIFLIDSLNHLKNLKQIYNLDNHVFLKRNKN